MRTLHIPILVLVTWLLTLAPRGLAATHFIFVDESGFSSISLPINAGDTVTWINNDEFFSHTTTSDLSILDPDYWNAFLIDYLDSFSKTFNRSGTFTYHDALDIGTGIITVSGANEPPTVAITEPAANTVFNAPASFTVSAQANDTDGILAVEFLIDEVSVAVDLEEPYAAAVTGLAAGRYMLAAVATDVLGAQSTNSLSIQVVAATITLENPRMSAGFFLFEGAGLTPGKSNVLEISTDLVTWQPLHTNLASSSTVTFSSPATPGRGFFRLSQLP